MRCTTTLKSRSPRQNLCMMNVLFIHLFIWIYFMFLIVHLSLCFLSLPISLHLPLIYLSITLSMYPTTDLFTYRSICHLLISLALCLSVCLPVCMSMFNIKTGHVWKLHMQQGFSCAFRLCYVKKSEHNCILVSIKITLKSNGKSEILK